MKRQWRGFTLIELLATMTIIGILTVLAIPAFGALDAREQFSTAARAIQGKVYDMHSLALAPPANPSDSYQIVGYGLIFTNRASSSEVLSCPINNNGQALVTMVEFVQYTGSSTIYPFIKDAETIPNQDPLVSPAAVSCSPIYPQNYAKDFYVLPGSLDLKASRSSTGSLGWVFATPLASSNYSSADLGNAILRNWPSSDYITPLVTLGSNPMVTMLTSASLVLAMPNVKVNGGIYCQTIKLTNDNYAAISTQIVSGCTQ